MIVSRELFQELNAAGITIVLVTHEMEIAVQADRMIRMRDGRIEEDTAVDDRRRQEILLTSQDAQKRIFRQKAAAKCEQDSANVASEARTIKKGG